MAMDGNAMGDAIAAAVKGVTPDAGTPITDAQLKAIWEAIGTANVAHLKANASVKQGIAVATTGSPSAQSGQTTAPGFIE